MLDPMIQALLERVPQLTSYAIWKKSPAEARADFKRFSLFAAPKDLPIGKVENVMAGTIPLRSYSPVAGGTELLPGTAFFHGGGIVLGDPDCSEALSPPLFAPDLTGLPPAYIVTAGLDHLRADAIAYAERLKQAGVPVVHVDYETMIHGFISMQGLIPLATSAIAAAAHAVHQALADGES